MRNTPEGVYVGDPYTNAMQIFSDQENARLVKANNELFSSSYVANQKVHELTIENNDFRRACRLLLEALQCMRENKHNHVVGRVDKANEILNKYVLIDTDDLH